MDVNTSTLSFRISLIDLDDLKPHEEVIEQVVTQLAQAIRDDNVVRDPLIVDNQYLVILDGMHRYNALKKIGCRRAPVCLVVYDDKRISVGAWFRFFNANDPEVLAKETLEALNWTYDRKPITPAQTNDFTNAAIITNLSVFQIAGETDRHSRSQLAVRMERHISSRGFVCEYAPENAVAHWPSSIANIVIPVPVFSKTEIRETATSGRLLPHKVTRHIIPSRPLKLDVPLDLLIDYSCEEANLKLDQLLLSRHLHRKPPGSVVDGRRYQEELLVFEG
jgi:hypothetical protein